MDLNRIIVTTDIHSVSGVLRVQAGAIGTIWSRNQGTVEVVFDDNQASFVEPDRGGRLSQEVPFLYTAPIQLL